MTKEKKTSKPDPTSVQYRLTKKRLKEMTTVKGASRAIAQAHKKAWQRLKDS